ncbi:MAG: glycosyltransferase, partial [Candidatus Altiarchaeales archaeon]|nr:glycosyltransferase [Candidatus Altiarchaeales archaeon]MBD3415562.1 glycosyltransferase [Candidatus Altiarchaeales archaeon]
MKVLEVTTSYPRFKGDWPGIFNYRLDFELVKEGVEVFVLAPGSYDHPSEELLDGIRVKRVRYFWPEKLQMLAYGTGIKNNLISHPWLVFQIPLLFLSLFINVLRHGRDCDIVHCHWVPMGFVGLLAKPFIRKPLILTPGGTDYRDLPVFFWKFVVERADAVIAVATETEKYMEKIGLKGFQTIRTLIDEDEFRPGLDVQGLREEFGLGDEKIVLFVGRLFESKGPMTFVEAAALVLGRRNDVRFIVVGDGEMKQDLLSYADGCGLGDGIIFT